MLGVIENRNSIRIKAELDAFILPDLLVKILDISETGISFESQRPLSSDKEYIRINLSEKDFINTEIDIVWKETLTKDKYKYGAFFIYLKDEEKNKLLFFLNNQLYLSKIFNQEGLNIHFVNIVDQMQGYLMHVEKKCNQIEQNGYCKTFEEEVAFIKSQQTIFRRLNSFFYYLWLISKDFSKYESEIHQKYAQQQLLNFFVRESIPFTYRIYTKPLGYAGDYGIMNYLYEDGYQGQGLYGKLINRYSLTVPAARAHIYRRLYFSKTIREVIEKNKDKAIIRIASFASGPAIEMLDVLESGIPDNVKFFCIDGEAEVLTQIRRRLDIIEKKQNKKCNVEIIHENILNMARKKENNSELKDLDYIYCAGFFDYISDRIACILLHYLFTLLKNKGILTILNMYKNHPCRTYLDFILEWKLYHREEEQMRLFIRDIESIASYTIDFDIVSKTNIYLNIQKIK